MLPRGITVLLRIWNETPGFINYHCSRCPESGTARDESKSNGHAKLNRPNGNGHSGTTTRTDFIYRNEDGTPYLRVTRIDCDGEKSYPQSHWNGAGWEKGKPAGQRIPYGLPGLVAAPGQPVFICEGEKCADAVAKLGWLATSASEGAGKWKAEL